MKLIYIMIKKVVILVQHHMGKSSKLPTSSDLKTYNFKIKGIMSLDKLK